MENHKSMIRYASSIPRRGILVQRDHVLQGQEMKYPSLELGQMSAEIGGKR